MQFAYKIESKIESSGQMKVHDLFLVCVQAQGDVYQVVKGTFPCH